MWKPGDLLVCKTYIEALETSCAFLNSKNLDFFKENKENASKSNIHLFPKDIIMMIKIKEQIIHENVSSYFTKRRFYFLKDKKYFYITTYSDMCSIYNPSINFEASNAFEYLHFQY